MDGPLALRLFQNDFITSFKFKIFLFCSNFEYYFEWLAPKATGDENGSDENDGAKVAAPKSPVPHSFRMCFVDWMESHQTI